MSGLGRITQETVEVLGFEPGNGRITQLYVEALAPVFSTARVTQETVEAIGPQDKAARVTQLYLEPIGPPVGPARITQLITEAIGPPAVVPCLLPYPIIFTGNVSGVFYKMEDMGAETVPIGMLDSSVILSNGMDVDIAATLTEEEQWITWNPQAGSLQIEFSNGNPVSTVWVVTNKARSSPPSIPVWATSRYTPLWKQLCTP